MLFSEHDKTLALALQGEGRLKGRKGLAFMKYKLTRGGVISTSDIFYYGFFTDLTDLSVLHNSEKSAAYSSVVF